jgi:alpha-D-xyloside xylohydrolase
MKKARSVAAAVALLGAAWACSRAGDPSGSTDASDHGGAAGSAGAGGSTSAGGSAGAGGSVGAAGSGGAGGAPGSGGGPPSADASRDGAGGAPEVPTDARANGVTLSVSGGTLRVELCTDSIVRVAFARSEAFFARDSVAAAPKKCSSPVAQVGNDESDIILTTRLLKVHVTRATGAVSFHDASDQLIVSEANGGGRTLTPAQVQGEATTSVRQEWAPNADESLYGLGQHQQGLLDIKGYDLDFHPYNTEVFIPFLVSSRGYGILWDNTSFTRFGDLRAPAPVPGVSYDPSGNLSGADAGVGSLNWSGAVQASTTGDYLFYTYSSGTIQLDLNGQRVIDHWRQGWLPGTDIARVHLQAGQSIPVRLQWTSDIGVDVIRFAWKTPVDGATTSLWSEVGDGVDYYFAYGPELDQVVSGYRRLTGQAPMMPAWAYGFFQSRDRYMTSQDSLDVLQGFRSRGIPIDVIVQDWQYWVAAGWGSHQFDATRFADPVGWINAIHSTYHARLMLSVWAKFYSGTANFNALNGAGFLYRPNLAEPALDFLGHIFSYYDAFNAGARQMYFAQIQSALFSKGVDGWWADASEPDIDEDVADKASPERHLETLRAHMNPTALGTASRVLNAYSIHNSRAFYEGQRAAAPNQRVFLLTRNGYAGQQRYGAATWSGDITSTWTAMRKQIAAGLGFSLSGMPYWTMDIGGYAPPARFSATTPTAANLTEWRELNARWFEFGAFVPIFRVHGQAPVREMWQFGGDTSPTYLAELKFDRLRYRLLPYVYSMAGAVTQDDATIMRPLVMDFPSDAAARNVVDEYMFGPALLVCPVTTYQASARSVYLPPSAGWYDFWSGARTSGGQTISAPAPYDAIPVYVRAGSILPTGPDLQYVGEKPADPVTLYVYAGADGAFSLYEDQGSTYDYEHGEFTRIPIQWKDATRTLTIGARVGTFAGMPASRTFNVILVAPDRPVGFSFTPQVDRTQVYTGAAATLSL